MGEEEGGATGTSGLTWVVDPIDGTVNYLYGIPAYAVSVAVVTGDPDPTGPLGGGGRRGAQPRDRRAVPRAPRRRRPADDRRAAPARCGPPAATDLGMALVGTGFGYDASMRGRARRPCSSTCCPGCATSGGTAVRPSTCAAWRPGGSTPTTRRRSTRGTARPASSSPARRGRSSAARSTTCPTRDLVWGAAPGLAAEFGALVRELSARHVGSLG